MAAVRRLVEPEQSPPKILHASGRTAAIDSPRHLRVTGRSEPPGGGSEIDPARDRALLKTCDHDAGAGSSSYYRATARVEIAAPPLAGESRADLCIVGGGLTGLSAALHAARAGLDTVLLECGALGEGASGRNGGQVHIGMRRSQPWLEARVGKHEARALWSLSLDARTALLELLAAEQIDCDWRPGMLHLDHKPSFEAESRETVARMRAVYGYDGLRFVERDEVRFMVASSNYHCGIFDAGGGHLHPLNLTLGIGRAAARAGARLHGQTKVRSVRGCTHGYAVETARGTVYADRVLLACDAALGQVDRRLAPHVMAINNFIVTTEPLGPDGAAALVRDEIAAADSRAAVYYFRRTPDHRLLFGGGETFGRSFSTDMAAFVRPHLLRVFPQLRDVRLDHAWGGQVSVTRNRLPYVRALSPGLYAIGGYSGMGIVLAPYFGRLLAQALTGGSTDFDRLTRMPAPRFPGGALLRWPILVGAMLLLKLRDRL
jgi:gamma-glutamylputrescine oxidase